MSYYPLLNYNWKDTSGNILPVANSYFAYGTLGGVPSNVTSNGVWYSLTVSNANSPSKIVEVFTNTNNLGNALNFNVSGIYQITTTLKFTGYQVKTIPLSGGMNQPQIFAFSYSTSQNRGNNLNKTTNSISGGIATDNLTSLSTSVTPYFINGSASGGSSNGFDTTNCGGQVAVLPTGAPVTYPPFFLLPNTLSTASTPNVNTITALYYIPAGKTIYFNIADTVNSFGNPSSKLDATGNFTVQLLNTIGSINTTYKPLLLNYTNGDLPISNSTFAYGILNQIPAPNSAPKGSVGIPGSAWGSLNVNSSLFDSGNNLVSVLNNGVKFNVSGIYQLTTILKFIGSSAFTTGIKTFVFSYSTAANTVSNTTDTFSFSNNWIGGPINIYNGTTLSTTPYFINGSALGGSSDYSNGMDSTNYGGNIGLTTNMSTTPFFIFPNYSDGNGPIENVNTVNAIYYIPAGTTIYFNIGYDSADNNYMFNAYGNYTIRLLSTVGTVNETNKFPLLNYNWSNSPIANSYFAYGALAKINNLSGGTYGDGLDWDSLTVKDILDNSSLVTKKSVVTTSSGLQFNVSGIYKITTTLQFTGTNGGGSQHITGGTQTFAFSYSNAPNTATTGVDKLSSTTNNIAGPINIYDGSTLSATPYFINGSASGGGADLSNGFDSTLYGGNVCMLPNSTTSTTIPPFFIMPNYMTTTTNSVNVNTINAIYYIPVATTLYFNIANTSNTDWLNATGNYTIELLNYLP